MSGKQGKIKHRRSTNPFTKLSQNLNNEGKRFDLCSLDYQKIETMITTLGQMHEALGKQIVDMASAMGTLAAENKLLQNQLAESKGKNQENSKSIEMRKIGGLLQKRNISQIGDITTEQITQKRKKFVFRSRKQIKPTESENSYMTPSKSNDVGNDSEATVKIEVPGGKDSVYSRKLSKLLTNEGTEEGPQMQEFQQMKTVKKHYKRKDNNLIPCTPKKVMETRSQTRSRINSARESTKKEPSQFNEPARLLSPFKDNLEIEGRLVVFGEEEPDNICEQVHLSSNNKFYQELSNGSRQKYTEIKMGMRQENGAFIRKIGDDTPEFQL